MLVLLVPAAAFLAEHPGFDIPSDQIEPTAELISHGLAAMMLWWADHPEVERATLVYAATRVITGLSLPA